MSDRTFKQEKELLELHFKMEKELLGGEKEITLIEGEQDKVKHSFHVRELEMQKELERLKHENALIIQRIRQAEIRKQQERKENVEFMKSMKNECQN